MGLGMKTPRKRPLLLQAGRMKTLASDVKDT